MKSSIFFWFYSLIGALALGVNYYQLQRWLASSSTIMLILITLMLSLQVPLYFLYRRDN